MPKPIATWNPARDVWETPQTEGLFCEHLDVYSETFPTSGMTANGEAYALPTWEPRTAGSESSYSPPSALLMTPVAAEGTKPSNVMGVARRLTTGQVFLTNQIVTLMGLDPSEKLLPSPRASEGEKGGPNMRGSKGDLMLSSAVTHLLPTPKASDGMMGTPATSGRPVEGPTFLATQVMLQQGHLEHRRTGASTNPRSDAGKQLWEDVPLPLLNPQGAMADTDSVPGSQSS